MAVAGLLSMSACGGSSRTAVTTTTTAATTTLATTTTTTAATTTTTAPQFGRSQDVILDNVQNAKSRGKVTVFAFKLPVATTGPQPKDDGGPSEYVWAAVDAPVCAGPEQLDPPAFSNDDFFILQYADNTQAEPASITHGNVPMPQFPGSDLFLHANECVRGWITYQTPNTRPSMVAWKYNDQLYKWPVP